MEYTARETGVGIEMLIKMDKDLAAEFGKGGDRWSTFLGYGDESRLTSTATAGNRWTNALLKHLKKNGYAVDVVLVGKDGVLTVYFGRLPNDRIIKNLKKILPDG
jgi:hypothetical protein